MEKKDFISIVVPIYNVSQYIENCIKSLLFQTFSNLEIILVNDGTLDDSMEKIQPLIQGKHFIKVIHQKNQGLSKARNTGIQQATSEYLMFLDSDDSLAPNFCEVIYQQAKNDKADIVIANIIRCDFDGIYYSALPVNPSLELVQKKKDRLRMIFEDRILCTATAKIYKKKLFSGKFFPFARYYEDYVLIPEIIMAAEKVAFAPLANYFYLQRENSIIMSKFSDKHIQDKIFSFQVQLALAKNYNFSFLEQKFFFVKRFRSLQGIGYWKSYQFGKKLWGFGFVYIFFRCYFFGMRKIRALLFMINLASKKKF